MNGQHLARVPIAEVEARVTPLVVAAGLATAADLASRRDWWLTLLELLRVRARVLDEIVAQATPYFREDFAYDADAVAKHWKSATETRGHLAAIRENLAARTTWDLAGMEEALRALAESRGIGAGKLLQPLRIALVGSAASPGIFEVMAVLGRDRTLARIARAEAELAARPG